MPDSGGVFVDTSVFMGMHSEDEAVRVACKNLFVEQFAGGVAMSLEHIGRCDDVVWAFPRSVQDAYYPFMDRLHSTMALRRVAYTREDLRRAEQDTRIANLPVFDGLLLARVCNEGGVLYTLQSQLLMKRDLPVQFVPFGQEQAFPPELEATYRHSLMLRIGNPISESA